MAANISDETPRERFRAIPGLIAAHKRFFETAETLLFLDYAMLEYQRKLSKSNLDDASARHYKSVGAHDFVTELLRLSEELNLQRTQNISNLNHRA